VEGQRGKLKALVWLAIAGLCIFGVSRLDRAVCFSGDSLSKLVQAESLRKSGFSSEELFYPGRAIDSEYRFYPFPGVYHLIIHGRHLGQYPIAFAAATGLLLKAISPGGLFILGAALYLLLMYLFDRFAQPSPLLLLFVAAGTPILTFSVDYSEHIYFALINFGGLILFLSGLRLEDSRRLFLGGMLIGLGLYLRLESLIFFSALFGGVCLELILSRRLTFKSLQPPGLFAGGFLVAAGSFFLFNALHYGHPLGPRFMANEEAFAIPLASRLGQIITLLFARGFQLGFFGYMPIFLFVLGATLLPAFRSRLDFANRSMALAMIFYLPVVAVASPGDGVVNWGPRFLLLAILPCALLLVSLSRFTWPAIVRAGAVLLCVVSIAFTFMGLRLQKNACRQLSQYQNDFVNAQADIWIFSSQLLSNYMGPEFFARETYLAQDAESARELAKKLRSSSKKPLRVAYFESVVPEEWKKALAEQNLVDRPEVGAELKKDLRATGEVKGRFTLATIFEIP
jgi:hypothetical protein